MINVLGKAFCFVGIIILGIILRRIKFFKEEDFHVISKIVVKVTLTAAIIINFANRELDLSLFVMSLFSFMFGSVLIIVAYLLFIKDGKKEQSFAVINMAGVNIGNFVIPFAQSFLSPQSIMAICLFDATNGMFCMGGTFAIADMISSGKKKFSIKPIINALLRSAPFVTYVIMVSLCLLHVHIPTIVTDYVSIISSANVFMAMLMIGVGFKLKIDTSQKLTIFKILVSRYLIAFIFALIAWFIIPLPMYCKQALLLLFMGPLPSAAPGFTAENNNDFGLASTLNSLSIILSIIFITLSLVFMFA